MIKGRKLIKLSPEVIDDIRKKEEEEDFNLRSWG